MKQVAELVVPKQSPTSSNLKTSQLHPPLSHLKLEWDAEDGDDDVGGGQVADVQVDDGPHPSPRTWWYDAALEMEILISSQYAIDRMIKFCNIDDMPRCVILNFAQICSLCRVCVFQIFKIGDILGNQRWSLWWIEVLASCAAELKNRIRESLELNILWKQIL